jgi:tetraacyldisaccharide 4'-kinase
MKSLILPPLSTLYGAITRARASLYERGTFRTVKLSRPVISVGNMTAGGTGKTPLVEWVARALAASGKKVCILTRGYGRANPDRRVLVSNGTTVFSNPLEAGDEPYLLASNLSGLAAVVVDANRIAAGEGAIKHLGTDCFVLDDGFQHLQLVRDLNIVTIDATNPWGGGQMLPWGRLREPIEGLKRADCIVLTRCDQVQNIDPLRLELARLSGDRPIFESRMRTLQMAPLNKSETVTIPKEPVAAFCAVGNPQSFFAQIRRDGFEPVLQKFFADHHVYTQADVDKVVKSAKQAGAQSLITTAKDAVKLHALSFAIPCYSLNIEMQIENAETFRRLLLTSTGG